MGENLHCKRQADNSQDRYDVNTWSSTKENVACVFLVLAPRMKNYLQGYMERQSGQKSVLIIYDVMLTVGIDTLCPLSI